MPATASGRRASSQGGALTAAHPKLYGFSFYCGIVAALRSARRMLPFRGLSGVSVKISEPFEKNGTITCASQPPELPNQSGDVIVPIFRATNVPLSLRHDLQPSPASGHLPPHAAQRTTHTPHSQQ